MIKFYKTNDPHGYMSNYWKAKFILDDKVWETTEHYYQAMKTLDPNEQEQVRNAAKANDARLLGQKVTLRADFNEVKDQLMRTCLLAKFNQHLCLKQQLIDTGDDELIEDSKVDAYWGIGADGNGQNKLGKLLMEIRSELRNERTEFKNV
jgi:ribA/ribD-fused uncharacterized protein